MIVYRISSPKWAKDLSGNVAKLYGGRWNSVGLPMLYTSENISLAMLEILVNSSPAFLKNTFSLIKISIPESAKVLTISDTDLPDDWNMYPYPVSTPKIGDGWLQSFESLALRVPSCANDHESNLLLNPLHQDYYKVKIESAKSISFEKRLFDN